MNNQVIQDYTTAVLAIILFGGTLAVILVQQLGGHPIQVPDVLSNLDFAAAGAYFVNQAARNGARTVGTAAAQTAVASANAASAAAAAAQPTPPPPTAIGVPPA